MRFKRTLLSIILFGLCVPIISSCGSKELKPFELPENGYDGSEVEICFYETMGHALEEVLDSYIVDFNELYPHINVTYKNIGGYNDMRDQLRTQLGVETDCTLTFCYPDHVALYNKSKKVVALDQLMNDSNLGLTLTEKNDFISAYVEEGQRFGDSLTYCLPFAKSTEVLYYNKTFFDQNSLQVPETWDQMWSVCEQIRRIDTNCTPLGYDSDANFFITLCEQYNIPFTSNNVPHFLFDNEQAKQIVKELKSYYEKGYFTTKGLYGYYTSGLFTSTDSSRCYMCIGSSAGASYQHPDDNSFEVGITSIPQADVVNHPAVISQGPSVCLFNNENPQVVVASWLFLKFLLTNVNFQAEYSMTSGYAPVIQSAYDNPIYDSFLRLANTTNNLQAASVKQSIAQRNLYFSSPVFIGSSTARDQVGDLLVACVNGTKTIDLAFSDALYQCQYQAGEI